MYVLRVLVAVSLAFATTSCTTANFNPSYRGASWSKVAIAPLEGDENKVVESRMVHEYATNPAIQLVESEVVQAKIEALGLSEKMEATPVAVLRQVSEELGAQGFIYGEVTVRSAGHQLASFAQVNLRLYANDGVIVGSSVNEESSMFFNSRIVLKRSSRDTVLEFGDFFALLNPEFDR